MPITAEFVSAAGDALAESCPLASQDPAAIEEVKAKVLKYVSEVGTEPSADAVVRWATPYELELQERAAAQADELAREADFQRRRELSLSPSDEARQQAIEDFRERNRVEPPPQFVPAREYTEKEKDAMSSEEYRRLVLGVTDRVEDKNQTAAAASNERSINDVIRKRILQSKKKSPMRTALRREIREGLR
jgi:hypothetical protein